MLQNNGLDIEQKAPPSYRRGFFVSTTHLRYVRYVGQRFKKVSHFCGFKWRVTSSIKHSALGNLP